MLGGLHIAMVGHVYYLSYLEMFWNAAGGYEHSSKPDYLLQTGPMNIWNSGIISESVPVDT